jgi:hypothetical protein
MNLLTSLHSILQD